MKVISYTALLYGKEYLYWAIRSVIDHVDEHHIIYDASGTGSHGHKAPGGIPCPDTRDELYAKAELAAGSKLRWHDGEWPYEGAQRDAIHGYAPDADVILVVDADEIWPDGMAGTLADKTAIAFMPRRVRVPIIHFWRSFYRCVLHDPAFPTRAIYPNNPDGETTVNLPNSIAHMGYAQRPAIVEYKQHTHGHRGEWRQDDWFNTVYMANAQVNCHPVGSEYWNPEHVNPAEYMPSFMSEHPYWGKDVIE